MTPQERQTLVDALNESHHILVRSVTPVSHAEFVTKPTPDIWSVSEIVEHLCILEDRVSTAILPHCLASERVEEVNAAGDFAYAEKVRARDTRFQAPPSAQPQSSAADPDTGLEKFAALRAKTIDYVRTTGDDLRHHRADHPVFGSLDGFQWLLILSAHTERHVKQIEELKTAL